MKNDDACLDSVCAAREFTPVAYHPLLSGPQRATGRVEKFRESLGGGEAQRGGLDLALEAVLLLRWF